MIERQHLGLSLSDTYSDSPSDCLGSFLAAHHKGNERAAVAESGESVGAVPTRSICRRSATLGIYSPLK